MTSPKRQVLNYWRFIIPTIFTVLAVSNLLEGRTIAGLVMLACSFALVVLNWRALGREQRAYEDAR